MWPVKPKHAVWLAKAAVYENTRKMQSDPKKRIQMQSNKMNDSSVERCSLRRGQEQLKKMQTVVWPLKSSVQMSQVQPEVQAQRRNITVNI